jgi:hypothetical protein
MSIPAERPDFQNDSVKIREPGRSLLNMSVKIDSVQMSHYLDEVCSGAASISTLI